MSVIQMGNNFQTNLAYLNGHIRFEGPFRFVVHHNYVGLVRFLH